MAAALWSARRMMQSVATGPLHDFMEKAMAEAVGLTVDEFNTRHANGETFYQIALAEGFTAEEIPALMQAARAKALDAAAADGVMTQEQADWMKSARFRSWRYDEWRWPWLRLRQCPMYGDGDASTGGQFGPRRWDGSGRHGRPAAGSSTTSRLQITI
jgi:hypothetical protein